EDIEYFLVPEKGKWYEIHYVANSNLEAVVNVIEIEPPESIEHTEEYDEIIIYIGEFIDKYTYGKGSNESIEYKFDANDGNEPKWFRDEEIEFFIIPEKGKWYEIQYVMKNTYKLVIDIKETNQP
ncbi:MAG: hypothetical protein IJA70_06910, partial [Oscillospiraceae bacterium]|nr:hypothetical protein [Oscillospiraceae bacterium]